MTTFGLCLDLGPGVVIRVWNSSGCLQMGGDGGDRRVPRPGVRLGYPRLGDSTPFSSLYRLGLRSVTKAGLWSCFSLVQLALRSYKFDVL